MFNTMDNEDLDELFAKRRAAENNIHNPNYGNGGYRYDWVLEKMEHLKKCDLQPGERALGFFTYSRKGED